MPTVQLLQVTDPHLFADESREIYDTNTSRSLAAVLDDALAPGRPRPDAVLVTGDVAEDSTAEAYGHFRRHLSRAGVPVYVLPGNHDDPRLMHEVLRGGGFQFLGDARLGGWQVVLLDTHVPRDPAGRLRDAELARLERTLRDAGDRPALVCLHHPPVSVGSPWLDGVGLLNGDALLRVVEAFPQVRAVLAGHVHQAFDRRHGGVRLLASPSTCAQFTPLTEDCVMDVRPPGYRRLALHDDGRIETEVHWLDGWRRAAPPRDTRGPEPSSLT